MSATTQSNRPTQRRRVTMDAMWFGLYYLDELRLDAIDFARFYALEIAILVAVFCGMFDAWVGALFNPMQTAGVLAMLIIAGLAAVSVKFVSTEGTFLERLGLQVPA